VAVAAAAAAAATTEPSAELAAHLRGDA
jgi:hypothetical protein